MPWRGHSASSCKRCARAVEECGKLSSRYLCAECGDRAMLEEKAQLRSSRGPYFEHWLRRCRAAFGIVTVDAPAEEA